MSRPAPPAGAVLAYGLRRLGWPALLGLLLLVAAAVFHIAALARLDAELAQTRAEVARLRALPPPAAARVLSPAQQAAEFRSYFPAVAALPDMLKTLHETAGEQGLTLERSEYRESVDPASGLLRFQVNLPFRGTYPQVRTWLDLTLSRLPTAALEELNLKRSQVGQAQLEGRARFTLYLGAG